MVEDMVKKMDPSQFGNLKRTSIQHYLISLIHRLMSSLDNNSKGDIFAGCVTLFDYQQAFSRQCHKLGVKSFIENSVRPSLIPIMINYFQGRSCQIKWRGLLSTKRRLLGSGAQGSILGNIEYISQTNNNADHVPSEDRWKWIDDLTVVEIVNMITVGLSTYNFRQHVASDIPVHGQYVSSDNLKTSKYVRLLDQWSHDHLMKLNKSKTKIMIINFTKKYQFATRVKLQNDNIQQVTQAKILGTVFTDKLTWDVNCSVIIKKCHMRLQLLIVVASFGTDPQVLKLIYLQYIRVILEGSCQVWSGGLTARNRKDLERIQKIALKIIMPSMKYRQALFHLNIEPLELRRKILTLRFARNARNHPMLKHLFTLNHNIHTMNLRKGNRFISKANTSRYMNSPILYMQKILNELER
jgi:hypothetical protein